MHGILRQIVVQVVLVLELKHESVCHALAERLPGLVLSIRMLFMYGFPVGGCRYFDCSERKDEKCDSGSDQAIEGEYLKRTMWVIVLKGADGGVFIFIVIRRVELKR